MSLPAGVIVNRANGSYPNLDVFCRSSDLPILLPIPFERKITEGIAQGKNLIEIRPAFRSQLQGIFSQIAANDHGGRA